MVRLLTLLCCFIGRPVDAGTLAVNILVNDSVAQTQLSTRELRAIYTMRLNSWANGLPVKVFVLRSQHPTHQYFCKEILRVLPHQLLAAWDRLIYSGMGEAPVELESESEMVSQVSNTPGAIGYAENINEIKGVLLLDVKD